MSCCGLRSIKLDSAQGIHMYGIFEPGDLTPDISFLKSEPDRFMKIYRRGRLKEALGRAIDKIGLNFFFKSVLSKNNSRY